MPPLRGLGAGWGSHFLHRCRPYGAKNHLLKKTLKIRVIRVICVIRDSDNEHLHYPIKLLIFIQFSLQMATFYRIHVLYV